MSEPTVERFTVFGREGTNCIAVADGHWVRFSDYDTLTEERDRLKEIVDGTGLATAAIAAERDRLAKANAELLSALRITRDRLDSANHSEFDGVWSDEDFAEPTAEADALLARLSAPKPTGEG